MLRELATVLLELHDAMLPIASARAAGVRLSRVDMTIPMDVQPVLRDGGCVLLADVSRSHADAPWRDAPSRLQVSWLAQDTAGLPPDPAGGTAA